MSALLVVDWDYFFPMPHDDPHRTIQFYDWGHSEGWGPGILGTIWIGRAAAFYAVGEPLPWVQGWEGFWSRFAFDPGCALTYANSNKEAILTPQGNLWADNDFDEVWLFDAHHDSGYGSTKLPLTRVSCEDWLVYFTEGGADTNVRYPRWHTLWHDVEPQPDVPPSSRDMDNDEDAEDYPVFTHVMVCRSDAWVPPWCDRDFALFIGACPVETKVCTDGQADKIRPFSVDDVANYAAMMEQARTNLADVTTDTVGSDNKAVD